jgi:hypothetical protein
MRDGESRLDELNEVSKVWGRMGDEGVRGWGSSPMVGVGSSSSCDLVGEGGDDFMMLRGEHVRVYSFLGGGGKKCILFYFEG